MRIVELFSDKNYNKSKKCNLTIYKKIDLILILILVLLLQGCKINNTKKIIPFSDAEWDNTIDEIDDKEDLIDDYDSNNGGHCYVYEKKYLGYNGNVRYIFNDDILTQVTWVYDANNIDELNLVYDTILQDIKSKYGKSDKNEDINGLTWDVWKLDDFNIGLEKITIDYTELQYSYNNPTNENN